MLDYAVIGTSWITRSFIGGTKYVDGMRLAAVYSRSDEKGAELARENGCERVFTSLEELAASDIGAVYIASPNALHYSQSRLMLESGKHVICEKPITVTPEELLSLQRLAQQKGLIYMEAIMHMHTPSRGLLRDALGKIGKITSVHFDFSQLSSKYPAYLRGELPNIFNPKMAAGGLMDLGVYCVYPALDFFGEPKKITASSHFMESGADGCGTAIFDYEDKQVTLTYSKTGQNRYGSQIFGDKGTICIKSLSQLTEMQIVYSDSSVEALAGDTVKERIMGYEAQDFYNLIVEPSPEMLEAYKYASSLSLKVSRAMAEIREQAGIKFSL
ncbi:MAG: Gfo/Idh/MocA family oxidoreductase [Clostridiales bacterium]|nr:Gfo/Idh/MocA family oxidoreductase [Clostridiales bacterium]